MNYGRICVLLLAVLTAAIEDIDYCVDNHCVWGTKHIACGNNGSFAYNCKNPEIINLKPSYKIQIFRKHNLLRNEIAKGFKYFPPATRMATMLWSNELAKLAELNVRQCEMRYDQCRGTRNFPFAAQNIAAWKLENESISEVIDGQIQEWFDEYRNCPLNVINCYVYSNGPPYSHFTNLVQERSNRVGCAILRSFSGGFKQQIMTCNYAYGNTFGTSVYTPGKTASQCTTLTNALSTSLCSSREKYNLKTRKYDE